MVKCTSSLGACGQVFCGGQGLFPGGEARRCAELGGSDLLELWAQLRLRATI